MQIQFARQYQYRTVEKLHSGRLKTPTVSICGYNITFIQGMMTN
uniref:Uncharacterized protein n=1 Tax=Rhizophora mucronata TaxID=61149 RepID=A0A2P2J6I7_RHIMU